MTCNLIEFQQNEEIIEISHEMCCILLAMTLSKDLNRNHRMSYCILFFIVRIFLIFA